MPELQSPRGMHDLLPEDEPLWRRVRDACERVARGYGYGFVETPIVEDERVFLRSVGAESDLAQKEMYLFEDRGGGRLALRPEATAAVCRAYLEHGMASRPQPVRLAYFGPMFRYDRPQAGRYRQLWQFGVECIGDASPAADVEVIEMQQALYRELGLSGLTLRINSIGTAESRRRYEQALRAHLEPHAATLSEDSRRRLVTNVLRVLDSKDDAGNPAVQTAPSITDALGPGDRAHFAEVRRLLEALDIDHEIDPRIVRGLDYYAHTVWEFEPPGGGGQSTVGAGGRYDGLIELLGGPPTPGTGFATGVERIIRTLREQGIEEPCAPAPDVVMVAIGEAGAAWAMRVAAALRRAGFVVRGATPARSLRAQLRTAGHLDARYAVIAGEREAATAAVQLKPLSATGEERTLDIEGVIGALGGATGPQPPAQSAAARAAEPSDA